MITQDRIVKIGQNIIQHGKLSDRVYLMYFAGGRVKALIERLDQLCRTYKYSKIFVKVPADEVPRFLAAGYRIEALVPRFYDGRRAGFFLAKYFSKVRKQISVAELTAFQQLLSDTKTVRVSQKKNVISISSGSFKIKKIRHQDLPALAELYRKVFVSYPFPIHSETYLSKMLNQNVVYFGVWQDGKLIGASSVEINEEYRNAEMTDFAVLPGARGQNLALALLSQMERAVRARGVRTLYTIARLRSLGINKTFLKAGYSYAGTLIRNTQIAGRLESMNVWYK